MALERASRTTPRDALPQALGVDGYPLLWLRYSGFLALYPIGVSSELTMVWLALHAIRSRGLLSLALPNALNFAFDYYTFCVLGMLVYLPGERLWRAMSPLSITAIVPAPSHLRHDYCRQRSSKC